MYEYMEKISLVIQSESKSESEVAQSCPTLCDPMDCSLPVHGSHPSSVHGILQAGVLEWVAISFSRRSSQPRDGTQVSRIAGRCFTIWATREDSKIVIQKYVKILPWWLVQWESRNALKYCSLLHTSYFKAEFSALLTP